jgi:Zn-dependent M28 family amino/carboxypeptidase
LAAHHDSVTTGPGAGDNGAGVVSVLAAMRALAPGPPPRHDVIAAFIDGEEHEMLDSLALVETAGWVRDVQVVVNTEGVGNAGRVTPAGPDHPDNGWAVRQYLEAPPSPLPVDGDPFDLVDDDGGV